MSDEEPGEAAFDCPFPVFREAARSSEPCEGALYDRLRVVAPSPVVDLNRAIGHSMAFGPEAGLRLVDEIADAAALRNYAPLPAARGDFLFRAGRPGRGAFRIQVCGDAYPQRAGKGLSPRAGGSLRWQALNPVSEAPLGMSEAAGPLPAKFVNEISSVVF